MRPIVVAATALLAGCAGYTPQQLAMDDAHSALAQPVAQVLERRASEVERPWLAPTAVDLAAPLQLDAIAALSVVNNPDLAALRARAGVAGAQVFAAGLLPDPTFSMGASQIFSGPDMLADLSGSLGLDLNALRTRSVRREQAMALDTQVRLDLAWAEWQTAEKAKIEAVRVVQLERIVTIQRRSSESAQSLFDRIAQAAGRGDVAGDRLQAAQIGLASAREGLRIARDSLASSQGELRRLLGLPPDYPLSIAELPPVGRLPANEALLALASVNRTDLSALRAGYAAQEAAVHQAVLEQFPNLGLTFNTQRDSAGNLLVGPAIDFTLPLWNRNRGAIATERATREALRAEYDARMFQTRADIAAATAGIALAAQRRAEALAVMPRLEQFAAASRRAASRGDLSLETAENAEQALRDRQSELVQAEQDYAEQMIALELLTGTPRGAWPQ